jgi:hypothetical protein
MSYYKIYGLREKQPDMTKAWNTYNFLRKAWINAYQHPLQEAPKYRLGQYIRINETIAQPDKSQQIDVDCEPHLYEVNVEILHAFWQAGYLIYDISVTTYHLQDWGVLDYAWDTAREILEILLLTKIKRCGSKSLLGTLSSDLIRHVYPFLAGPRVIKAKALEIFEKHNPQHGSKSSDGFEYHNPDNGDLQDLHDSDTDSSI